MKNMKTVSKMIEAKARILALASVALATALGGCQSAAEKAKEEDGVVRVLMIGNSFSISCLAHLPKVAADCGVKLDLGSLYIGGCSLEQHVKNARAELSDDPAVRGKGGRYRYDRATCGEPARRLNNARLTEALQEAQWDVVTIQQASHLSWRPKSYKPWGDELVAIVRRFAPQAKVFVQETWSYTPFDKRLAKWKMTQDEMYEKLEKAYRGFAAKRGFGVIPMGDAVQAWRRELPVKYTDHSFGGDVTGGGRQKECDHFKRNADLTWSLNSDGFHLNAKGEYFQALVWATCLLGVDLEKSEARPACVTEDEDKLMRRIATRLAEKPRE